jgi:anti-sigma factor RsiW
MTCNDARHLLLTAELSVVSGQSDTELRSHLATCPACAAVSARIVKSTALLATALRARRTEPVRRTARDRKIAMSLIPVVLAAGIALTVVKTSDETPVTPARSALDDSIVAVGKVAAAALDSPTVRVVKNTLTRVAVAAMPSTLRDTARLIARAVRAADPELSQVRVAVAEDQRATIIATSNPRVTLVWLTKGDSL